MMVKVKICGLRDAAMIEAAADAGADFVGFVHFPKSPRHLALDEMATLVAAARSDGRAKSVVLLVDPADELVGHIARTVKPDYLQLHGHESPERVAQIRASTGIPIIKAVPVATADNVADGLRYFAPGQSADILLFDAKPPPGATLPGGNGLAFDWTILSAAQGLPDYMLAGGLTPENVAEAVRVTGAPMVDVSSGVESRTGVKDAGLIRRFLRAAKGANQANERTEPAKVS
ncbi:MAG: phosphoribosylanthranilate isomerase [Hyphomicrobium sp.]|nr:phosphoribosylanthranilate isomerase [Hyphomicrobium sp.]